MLTFIIGTVACLIFPPMFFAVGIQRGMDEVNSQIAGKDIQISGMETEIQILKAENARYREAFDSIKFA